MIDLHSHILPGLDDGAADMEMALEMARIAIADGTAWMACTPHITPSVHENDTRGITDAVAALQREIDERGMPLKLVVGADFHICDNMLQRLHDRSAPTIAGSRYFLFEPPHNVMPPKILAFAKSLIGAGFKPVLTHPERLKWIEERYDTIRRMEEAGMAIQLTAGALTGRFGDRARYWSERMIEEGRVDLIASDAHNTTGRPPGLSEARDAIAARMGETVAAQLSLFNPARILKDIDLWSGPLDECLADPLATAA